MEWKPRVTLEQENGCRLCMGGKCVQVAPKDVYIAMEIQQGCGSVEHLKTIIAKTDNINEVAAAFSLAQFILNYGDFIEDDTNLLTLDIKNSEE